METQFQRWWREYRERAGTFVRAQDLAVNAWSSGYATGLKEALAAVAVGVVLWGAAVATLVMWLR